MALYHFGVLTSSVHMAWMRAVCGRLEMRYRYSKDIVYNNFPWPGSSEGKRTEISEITGAANALPSTPDGGALAEQFLKFKVNQIKIEETAQSILDARARYPDASLAAYGLPPDIPEPALVAHLMRLYQGLVRG